MGRVGRLAMIALGSIARIVAATTIFLPAAFAAADCAESRAAAESQTTAAPLTAWLGCPTSTSCSSLTSRAPTTSTPLRCPGLHTQGDSHVEATENAHQALELYIDVGDEDDPHRAWPGGGVPATRAVS
jgi:hypothetical protein